MANRTEDRVWGLVLGRALARVPGEDLAAGLEDGVGVVDSHRHLSVADDDQVERASFSCSATSPAAAAVVSNG